MRRKIKIAAFEGRETGVNTEKRCCFIKEGFKCFPELSRKGILFSARG
jgi:hypothetical protein